MKNFFCIQSSALFLFFSSLLANINDFQVFITCEGSLYDNEGSIWTISNGEINSYSENPIGTVAQSALVHNKQLFVIVNVSSELHVFDIIGDNIILSKVISTNGSGPREMVVFNDYLYFSNWYSADIKKLNLKNWEIEYSIPMPGLPEDLVVLDSMIYTSITMNSDWSDGNLVVKINPETDQISNTYDVGSGPGDLLVYNNDIYVSRTYYDNNWNSYYGTSKINSDGNVISLEYGSGTACGGSLHLYQNSVFRTFEGGIAKLDSDLSIIENTRIGNYEHSSIYSVEVIGDNIYFGLTDYSAPDDIKVINANGIEIASYVVDSAFPGDFAYLENENQCNYNLGDVNLDYSVNIFDIILMVQFILGNTLIDNDCAIGQADHNFDGNINILDCLEIVQLILNSK